MDETEEIKRLLADMPDMLEEFKRTGTLSAESLKQVQANARSVASQFNENAKAVAEASQKIREFIGSMVSVANDLMGSANAIRENRESFQGLNGAMSATVTVVEQIAGAAAGLINVLGNAALISGIVSLNPALIGIGGGIKIFGDVVGDAAEAAITASAALFNFGTKEIDRQVQAFRQLSGSGVITAEAFAGLRRRARETGLSFDQFSGVIAKTSTDLTYFSGDAAKGADALARLSFDSAGTRRQLLNLGIGFEQQNELLAQSLSFNRRIGRNQLNDQRTLSQASTDYVVQLTALSRLTGASKEEVQASINRVREIARSRGAIEMAVQGMAGQLDRARISVGKNIQDVFVVLEKKFGPELATAFANSLQGVPVGDVAKEFTFLTQGALPQLALALRNGQITAGEFQERLYDASQANADNVRSLAAFNAGVGAFGEANYTNFLDFVNSGRISAETFDGIADEVRKTMETQEESTKTISEAQVTMQNFAVQMDTLVDKAMPAMTSAIQTFADFMVGPGGIMSTLVQYVTDLIEKGQQTPSRQPSAGELRREQRNRGPIGDPDAFNFFSLPQGGGGTTRNQTGRRQGSSQSNMSPPVSIAGPGSAYQGALANVAVDADFTNAIKALNNQIQTTADASRVEAADNSLMISYLDRIARSTAETVTASKELKRSMQA